MAKLPSKTCGICETVFYKTVTTSRSSWEKRQGCSPSCAAKFRDNSRLNEFKFKKGHEYGKATRFSKGSTEAESNFQWKGDKASYAAKHIWVKYHFGKADHCENCLSKDRKMYHWSNISGNYLRDRDDWQQLCVPCHKAFDKSKA